MKITIFHSIDTSIPFPQNFSVPVSTRRIDSPALKNHIVACIFYSNEEDSVIIQQVEREMAKSWVPEVLRQLEDDQLVSVEVSVESICQMTRVDMTFGEEQEDEDQPELLATLDNVVWPSGESKEAILTALEMVQRGAVGDVEPSGVVTDAPENSVGEESSNDKQQIEQEGSATGENSTENNTNDEQQIEVATEETLAEKRASEQESTETEAPRMDESSEPSSESEPTETSTENDAQPTTSAEEVDAANPPQNNKDSTETTNAPLPANDTTQAATDSSPEATSIPTKDIRISPTIPKPAPTSTIKTAFSLLSTAATMQEPPQSILLGQYMHILRRFLQDDSLTDQLEMERFLAPSTIDTHRLQDARMEFTTNYIIADAYLKLNKRSKALAYISRNQYLSTILKDDLVEYQTFKQLLAYYTATNNDVQSTFLEQMLALLTKLEKEAGKDSNPLESMGLSSSIERIELQLLLATVSQNIGKPGRSLEVLENAALRLKRWKSSEAVGKKLNARVQSQLKALTKLEGMHMFKVTLLNGRGLPARDLSGKSDPYVIFTVNKEQRRVSSVKEQTLNPDWNENFLFKLDPNKDVIDLRVMDEDKFTPDDLCGTCSLEMSKYTWVAGMSREIGVKLNTTGTIKLKVELVLNDKAEEVKKE